MTAFSSLPLSPAVLANLQQLGYASMTPIQATSLPIALASTVHHELALLVQCFDRNKAHIGACNSFADSGRISSVVLAQRWAPEQASMPIMRGGKDAMSAANLARGTLGLSNTDLSVASTQ